MSIFDDVIGSASSFADAAFSAAGLGSDSSKSSSEAYYKESTQISRENRILNLLQSGKMQMPYRQGDEFVASKSKPADQVDSESVNQQWLQRLSRYASIPQVQGAKEK